MNKQIKRLAWKYFWAQKRKEVYDFFEENLPPFLAVLSIAVVLSQLGWIINEETGLPECKTIAIIGLCIIGFGILIGLRALIKVIRKWLRSNWTEALERAEEETIKETIKETKLRSKI